MTFEVNGQVYYTTSEACQQAGVSRATLYRWLSAGILEHYHKHRRGWRIFTEEDMSRIKAQADRVDVEDAYHGKNGASV